MICKTFFMKNFLIRSFYKIRSRKRCILIIMGLLTFIAFIIVLRCYVPESSKVKDVNGNIYQTVLIGEQVWLAENLNTQTHTEGESWCYNDSEDFCEIYGRLYNWEAAKVVCPDGWRLPAESDWDKLANHFEGAEEAAKFLKADRYWGEKDLETLKALKEEESSLEHFHGLPGGHSVGGSFYDLGGASFWWSSSDLEGIAAAWARVMRFKSEELLRSPFGFEHGFSVRCIKEEVENG
jgi:uncharacterized protein (TIGR02145 family)